MREPRLREERDELKDSILSSFHLNDDDFQTIKVQLRALGLIRKSDKPRSVKDVGTYWTLTPYGDDLMTRLRAIKRMPVVDEPPVIVNKPRKKKHSS